MKGCRPPRTPGQAEPARNSVAGMTRNANVKAATDSAWRISGLLRGLRVKRSRFRSLAFAALAACVLAIASTGARAQDIEPRAYSTCGARRRRSTWCCPTRGCRTRRRMRVSRPSALMDERYSTGTKWTPRLVSPIKWTSVNFLFADHLGLTSDPGFTDNVLFLLLESPR